ncbi:MAG TPA: anti-sigma factor domain-containing protein [Bacilli bacterium]
MNRGIVMEMGKRHLVVLTPDGRFLRIPRKERVIRIGEEIDLPVLRRRSLSATSIRYGVAAAAIFSIILFTAFGMFAGGQSAVAYVTIDINPSVELGVDNNQNVVEGRGLNEDGENLLSGFAFRGKPLVDVTEALISKAQELQLIPTDEADIVISSTVVSDKTKINDAALANTVKERVSRTINAHPEHAPEKLVVAALPVPRELREEAKKKGISPGKMALNLIDQKQEPAPASPDASSGTNGNSAAKSPQSDDKRLSPKKVEQLLELQRKQKNNPEKVKQLLKEWVQENKEQTAKGNDSEKDIGRQRKVDPKAVHERMNQNNQQDGHHHERAKPNEQAKRHDEERRGDKTDGRDDNKQSAKPDKDDKSPDRQQQSGWERGGARKQPKEKQNKGGADSVKREDDKRSGDRGENRNDNRGDNRYGNYDDNRYNDRNDRNGNGEFNRREKNRREDQSRDFRDHRFESFSSWLDQVVGH